MDESLVRLDEEVAAVLSDESGESDIEILEVRNSSNGQLGEDAQAPAQPEPGRAGLSSLRCPICLETPEIVAVAACGHPYCHECVYTALSSSRRATRVEGECSLCRKRVRYDQTLYMELKLGQSRESAPSTPAPAPSEQAST